MDILIKDKTSTTYLEIMDASDGGYFYQMYDGHPEDKGTKDIDGGLCTGTEQDAILMAMEQAGLLTLDK